MTGIRWRVSYLREECDKLMEKVEEACAAESDEHVRYHLTAAVHGLINTSVGLELAQAQPGYTGEERDE